MADDGDEKNGDHKKISKRLPTLEDGSKERKSEPRAPAVPPPRAARSAGRLPTLEDPLAQPPPPRPPAVFEPEPPEPHAGAVVAPLPVKVAPVLPEVPVLQKYAPPPPAPTAPARVPKAISKPPPPPSPAQQSRPENSGNFEPTIDDRTAPEPYSPQAGDLVDSSYQVIRKLGAGGMGSVWLARELTTGALCAIKFLTRLTDPQFVARFQSEAHILAKCQCDYVVNVMRHGLHEFTPYIVTAYVKGRTLHQEIQRCGKLPLCRTAEIGMGVCEGLRVIHSHKVVHRDIKATNIILLDESGRPVILDFGVAKHDESKEESGAIDPKNAAASGVMGTPRYMAREQVLCKKPSEKTDVYAVGVLLYEMLSGKLFLASFDERSLILAIASADEFTSSMIRIEGAPAEIMGLVTACLRKDPGLRPTIVEVMRVLEKHRASVDRPHIYRNPYPGIAAFSSDESEVFFGRTEPMARVSDLVRLNSFTLVAGESGVGKTSLMKAGAGKVLEGEGWHVVHTRVGHRALAQALAHMTDMDVAALEERLRAQPAFAGMLVRAYATRMNKRVAIMVDALEELFTLERDEQVRENFAKCLLSIADDQASPIRVAACMRSDFIGSLAQIPGLASTATSGLYLLPRPTVEELEESILQPAKIAGYVVKPEVARQMAQELVASDAAFLLMQYAMRQAWDKRDPSQKNRVLLYQRIYAEIGGVVGALGRHAESVLQGLPPDFEPIIRRILRMFVTPERTRAALKLEQLYECGGDYKAVDEIIRVLVKGRLIVVAEDKTATLIHDALITKWDRLKQALDQMTLDDALRQKLQKDADAWMRSGKNTALLWTGSQSLEAKLYRDKFEVDGWNSLPALFKEFIEATVEQLEIREKKKRRRLMTGIGALSAVALGALFAVYLIGRAELAAKRESEIARAAESVAKRAEAAAQQARKEALANAERANRNARERDRAAKLAEESSEALRVKNEELLAALDETELARRAANKSSRKARQAEARALATAEELRRILESERERIRALESSMGSETYETVKE